MLLKNATVDKKSVAVAVNAEKRKVVNVKPIINSDGADMNGITTQFNPLTIDIYGESAIIDTTQWIETEPLTFKETPELNKEYKVNLVLPSGVRLKEGISGEVMIQFKK